MIGDEIMTEFDFNNGVDHGPVDQNNNDSFTEFDSTNTYQNNFDYSYLGNHFSPNNATCGIESILHYNDPLLHVNSLQMEPLQLHHVNPHYVEGYVRSDGTVVNGYFRDGDGDGYLRSNPDGIKENNLNY